jgi:hypothetical protein
VRAGAAAAAVAVAVRATGDAAIVEAFAGGAAGFATARLVAGGFGVAFGDALGVDGDSFGVVFTGEEDI